MLSLQWLPFWLVHEDVRSHTRTARMHYIHIYRGRGARGVCKFYEWDKQEEKNISAYVEVGRLEAFCCQADDDIVCERTLKWCVRMCSTSPQSDLLSFSAILVRSFSFVQFNSGWKKNNTDRNIHAQCVRCGRKLHAIATNKQLITRNRRSLLFRSTVRNGTNLQIIQ